MSSREPPAAPGLMRNIMSRQEATPNKQVCQENRLKVGLQMDKEGRTLRDGSEHQASLFHFQPHPSWCESFPFLCLFSRTQAFSHRKLGAEAHSRLRQDRSTAA